MLATKKHNTIGTNNLKVSRDQSFAATKNKKTRKKTLVQENTKDSGMR